MTIRFSEDSCTYNSPISIPYDKFRVNWIVNDQKHSKTSLSIVTLAESKTMGDLGPLLKGEMPSWVEILWVNDTSVFGSELEKVRRYNFEYDLKTLDSYQGQPLYMICANEESATKALGPIGVKR